jgi:hypothetical protein
MNVKQSFLRLLMLGLLVLGAGCSLIPLRSLWALRSFDFNQLDGAHLRALVYLPAGVATLPDALKLSVKVERGNGEALTETLALRPNPAALTGLPPAPAGAAGHWLALTLDAAEQQRLAQLRQRLQAWKAADGPDAKRKLALEAEPQLCVPRGSPALTAGQVRLSAWLRWKAGQDDLLLLDDATARDMDEKLTRETLPPCS